MRVIGEKEKKREGMRKNEGRKTFSAIFLLIFCYYLLYFLHISCLFLSWWRFEDLKNIYSKMNYCFFLFSFVFLLFFFVFSLFFFIFPSFFPCIKLEEELERNSNPFQNIHSIKLAIKTADTGGIKNTDIYLSG